MVGGLPEEVTLGQGPEQEREPAMQISEGSVCLRSGDSICQGPVVGWGHLEMMRPVRLGQSVRERWRMSLTGWQEEPEQGRDLL